MWLLYLYLIIGLIWGALLDFSAMPSQYDDEEDKMAKEIWHGTPLLRGGYLTLAILSWPIDISVTIWNIVEAVKK